MMENLLESVRENSQVRMIPREKSLFGRTGKSEASQMAMNALMDHLDSQKNLLSSQNPADKLSALDNFETLFKFLDEPGSWANTIMQNNPAIKKTYDETVMTVQTTIRNSLPSITKILDETFGKTSIGFGADNIKKQNAVQVLEVAGKIIQSESFK